MQEDAWLRDVKQSAERITRECDPRQALHDGEKAMITQAQIILRLLSIIDRLKSQGAVRHG
jgi:hypothetical protein